MQTQAFKPSQAFHGLILIAYTGFLFRCAVATPEEIPEVVLSINEYVLHFFMYFLLFLLAWRTFLSVSLPLLGRKPIKQAVFYGFIVGTATEISQYFVPERFTNFFDWGMNLSGVIFGCLLIKYLVPLTASQKEKS